MADSQFAVMWTADSARLALGVTSEIGKATGYRVLLDVETEEQAILELVAVGTISNPLRELFTKKLVHVWQAQILASDCQPYRRLRLMLRCNSGRLISVLLVPS